MIHQIFFLAAKRDMVGLFQALAIVMFAPSSTKKINFYVCLGDFGLGPSRKATWGDCGTNWPRNFPDKVEHLIPKSPNF